MKDDIKQKFLDILFEKEEEDVSSSDEKAPVTEAKESTLKARDVLYHKPKSSAFIDYNNQNNIEKKSLNVDEADYEFSVPISPIFGVIKENKKETVNVAPEITDTLVNKPENSHLEIITSPIYGYGREENTFNNTENVDEDEYYTPEDEEEIHRIFDDEPAESDNENDYEDDLNLFNSFGDYR